VEGHSGYGEDGGDREFMEVMTSIQVRRLFREAAMIKF
jgi:hypothetical protein